MLTVEIENSNHYVTATVQYVKPILAWTVQRDSKFVF
jgi:hypothetical protein